MIKTICIGSLLFFFSTMAMAHEGEPNMAFAWRDGEIEVDIQRQGRALGGGFPGCGGGQQAGDCLVALE